MSLQSTITQKSFWTFLLIFIVSLVVLSGFFLPYDSRTFPKFSSLSDSQQRTKMPTAISSTSCMNDSTDNVIAMHAQHIDIKSDPYAQTNLKLLSFDAAHQRHPSSLLEDVIAIDNKAMEVNVYPQWIIKSCVVANEEITALVSKQGLYSIDYVPRDAYILYAPYSHAQSVANDSRIKFVSVMPTSLKMDSRLLKSHPTSSSTKLIVYMAAPINPSLYSSEATAEHWQTQLQQLSSPSIIVKASSSQMLVVTLSHTDQLQLIAKWLSERPEIKSISPMSEFHLINT